MFKGGTLTILKTCQWSIFETFLYCQFQSSGTVTLQWHSGSKMMKGLIGSQVTH